MLKKKNFFSTDGKIIFYQKSIKEINVDLLIADGSKSSACGWEMKSNYSSINQRS